MKQTQFQPDSLDTISPDVARIAQFTNIAQQLKSELFQANKLELYKKLVYGFSGSDDGKFKELIWFLYQSIDKTTALKLALLFCYRSPVMFEGTAEAIQSDAQSLINLYDQNYAFYAKLNLNESVLYGCCDNERERLAFRICRYLAKRAAEDHSPGEPFYMSCSELRSRIGLRHDVQADRLLKRMKGFGLLRLVRKGDQRAKGEPAIASVWEWLF